LISPHLVVHAGARTIPLEGRHWSVGRSADNFIVIDEVSISRKHAMLQRLDDDQIYLMDLGSRNGTFVNDRRVTVPTTVRDGDRIRFGMAECSFHWPGAARPETVIAQGPATSLLQIRRLISVVVIDIRDYTALTRRTDEQVLSRVMAEWFRQIGGIGLQQLELKLKPPPARSYPHGTNRSDDPRGPRHRAYEGNSSRLLHVTPSRYSVCVSSC